MEFLTTFFLIFLFLAIYFMVLFIVLFLFNSKKIFYFPIPKKKYKISFLVPAYNEEKTIGETIKSIFNSKYPIEEVIAINDGSTDNTRRVLESLAKKYGNLRILNKKNSGKADSLNKGIEIAKGEFIAVVDADSYPSPDAVEKMIGFFNDAKVGAVTSCVFIRNKNKFIEKIQEVEYILMAWNRKLLDFVDSVYVTNGPLSIYRKDVLKEVGGFDVKSVTEDIEVTWHILSKGYMTRMSLASRVYTTAPSRLKAWWNQRLRWGVGGLETIAKYRKFFFKKGIFGGFVIPFVSFSILMSIVTFIFSGYLIYKNFAATALYAGYSISMQSTIFNLENLNTSPTIIFIMVIILFLISFTYFAYVLRIMREGMIKTGKVFNTLLYMFLYLTLYPLVWFGAAYRIVKRERKW